jgi:hypothetical protein
MAPMVQYLPSKLKAQSSNPAPPKRTQENKIIKEKNITGQKC